MLTAEQGRLGRSRGAVLVETALVMSVLLTLVLGAIQLGVVGFLQVTVDAGAFLNAHQTVIGVNDVAGPADATHQVFPQINASSITTSVQTAPSPTIPVDYLYNGTTSEQATSASNRHGGASMMQPYLQQTNIDQVPFTFLGQAYHVKSQASEADWLESVPEWDIANANYGQSYAAGNNQLNANVFTQGENTPVYYIGFDFIEHCENTDPWTTCTTQDYLSLGTAEYVDVYNWANPVAGVSGPANSTGTGGTTGTFEAMACHQRMFATVADFLNTITGGDPLNSIETTYNPYYANRAVTNFHTSTFFGTTGSGGTASAAIDTIYGWDVERGSGPSGLGTAPGDNPLHPTTGCV